MGIKKTRTTAYHPQCDGLVERQNRTLQDILSNFVSEHSVDWDEWLDQAVFSFNTSVQESTSISPYEMVFGRPARMPVEVELGIPLQDPVCQSEYSQSLRKAIQSANQIAQGNLEASRARQATNYDKGYRDWEPFEAGQTVWLRRPKHGKFGKRWIGPYIISSREGVNYTLRSEMGKTLVAHHNQLKICPTPLGRGLPVHPVPETPGIIAAPDTQEELRGREQRNVQGRTARPPHLRQVINPPDRFGDVVTH